MVSEYRLLIYIVPNVLCAPSSGMPRDFSSKARTERKLRYIEYRNRSDYLRFIPCIRIVELDSDIDIRYSPLVCSSGEMVLRNGQMADSHFTT